MQRVVITGIGVVCPLGNDKRAYWDNLSSGHSGIGELSLFDVSGFPVRIGGQVRGIESEQLQKSLGDSIVTKDRKVLLGSVAALEAIKDSGLTESELRESLLFSGVGLEEFCLGDVTPYSDMLGKHEEFANHIISSGQGVALQTPLDSLNLLLSDRYGFSAGRYVNCSACAAGAQVIGEVWQMLQDGAANSALVGATDSMLNPLGLGGFSILRVLSDENDQPQRACRPFDATRKGTVLGEGAGFMILETLEHAVNRNAQIYAEILGYGSSMDAFRVSDPIPDGTGAIQSMTKALQSAGLKADDIDCINAHGTGTPKNDEVETKAIKHVFGDRAYDIPVHAVKSMTGHMIAASGAVEAIAAVLTISKDVIPPVINLENPDELCDLSYVTEAGMTFNGDTVLSNSFGFGGQNATLLFGRYNQ